MFINTHDGWLSLFIALCVIGFTLLIGWDNNRLIPPFPIARFHYRSSSPLNFMSNWDGPNYIAIAKHGYMSLFYASFFPLYPLLIKSVSYVLRSYLYSALLISWSCLVGAIYFFIKVLRNLGSLKEKASGLKPAMFLILFPTAVFLTATYTESLFAFITLLAVYLVLKKNYLWVPILMFLISITHITGVFVVVLIAMMLWEQRARIRFIIYELAGGFIGLVVFMAYLKGRFSNAYAFFNSQTKVHGWMLHNYMNLVNKVSLLNILLIVLIVAAAVYYWRRKRSFAIYSLFFLLIPLAGRQYGGFNRYVLMAFPIQFMLFEYFERKKLAYPYVLALMAVIWTYTVLQYAAGYIGS